MRKSNLVLLITEIFATVIGLVSAYGSNCITFDIDTTLVTLKSGNYAYGIVVEYQWLWYITTTLTYLAAIASVVITWALIKRKAWFYTPALITAFVGAITGWTPFLLIVLDGGFTPSFLRGIFYTLVLVLLIIPSIKRGVETRLNETEAERAITDSGDKSASVTTYALILGVVLMAIPSITAATHDTTMIMHGLNYLQIASIVFYLGLASFVGGLASYIFPRVSASKISSPIKR